MTRALQWWTCCVVHRNGTNHGDDDVDVLVMAPGPHQQFGGQDGHQDDGV